MTSITSRFLTQSYQDNWADYQYLLTHTKPTRWDDFIITASNERQAEAYREQIAFRVRNGWLPAGTRYLVIPDPDGKRVGSGGATLNVLRLLQEQYGDADAFTGRRILVLHSGGDSRRVPQYSACGKLFSRVPRELPDGRCSTLFDEFVISLCGIPARMSDGVLVMSGDVLLLFNPLQVDLQREGTACISIKAPVEIGSHHGVFLPGAQRQVRRFLHKQTVAQLTDMGAVNEHGCVDIDTGAIWLGSQVVNDLLGLFFEEGVFQRERFAAFVNETVRLNFYGDFVYPMTTESTLGEYLREPAEGEHGPALEACRRQLWPLLHRHPMHIIRLSPGEFIHFGTTRELRDLMLTVEQTYGFLGWRKTVMGVGTRDAAVVNGLAETGAMVSSDVYLEDSVVAEGATVAAGCVLSNVRFSGHLPEGTVLHALPVGDEDRGIAYVVRLYGVDDNPKDAFPQRATFLGKPLADFLVHNDVAELQIWPAGQACTLWTARLFPVCATMEEAVAQSLVLTRMAAGTATPEETASWLAARRMSLCESFEAASTRTILAFQQEVEDRVRTGRFIGQVAAARWVAEAAPVLGRGEALARRLRRLAVQAGSAPFALQFRLYRAISELCRTAGIREEDVRDGDVRALDAPPLLAERYDDLCYERINREILEVVRREGDWPLVSARMACDEVTVALPVRLNWGGGWSDTPPYCLEHGGTVINAAITLRGALPVRVAVRRLDKPVVVLESRDLGFRREYADTAELRGHGNPSDPFALHKVALDTAGVLDALDAGLCEGIHLCTEVDVPKGSGLGTSSILAGAAVKALRRAYGLSEDDQGVFDQVLCMEQLMTTGGGWQDQVGGIVPGVKLIRSPGQVFQKLTVEPLQLSEAVRRAFDERLVLVYTGQRRLARNLLREIVGKYILGQPDTLRILNEIQHLALLMRYELEKGSFDAFVALVNRHWQLSRELDAGTANTSIDQIVQVCEPLVDGVFIAGAGGGGFLQMFLKEGVRREQLAAVLDAVYQDSGVEVWACGVVW